MAQRSDQPVASQDLAPAAPDEPPTPRGLMVGWTTAALALGVSSAILGLGLWLARLPLAKLVLDAALSERGVEADFQIVNLDFNSLALADVRLGSESEPDAAVAAVEADWSWNGLSPQLDSVRLVEPRLRLRLDPRGRVSAGALDQWESGPPGRRRPQLSRLRLEIVDGSVLIEAPFGALEASIRGGGVLGEDFSAIAIIGETSQGGRDYALDRGGGELLVVARDDTVSLQLSAQAEALVWAGVRIGGASLRASASTPLDLGRFNFDAAWRTATIEAPALRATDVAVAVNGEGTLRENALQLADWQGQTLASAERLAAGDAEAQRVRFEARGEGVSGEGRGEWTLGASGFSGFALISDLPSAQGRFVISADRVASEATATLARASLDAAAQDKLRAAFPDLESAPMGPTLAQAERALDAAADSFILVAPFNIAYGGGGLRASITAPLEARAASGARLRLSPLRGDTPALLLQWPAPEAPMTLHGAVDLELSGGGAPQTSLLLDTITWSPGAPFEADGTLTIANWRAEGASIAADELGLSLALAPRGGGRVELHGPVRLTGPLGEGQVRDLIATLDLAVVWDGASWRVTPNTGCLAIRMAGLDAAGLSFSNGAFALCPLNGALIAADSGRNFSGGFAVRNLALSGRMAGPDAQPARISAANIIGRFRGRAGDLSLALEAAAPALAIEMGEDRRLAISLRRLTADAHLANGWSVEGGFEHGVLADPAMPGSVTAIAGRWSAAPEDGKPVIRVAAGEALLIANRPDSNAERPLFNPLRLVNVDAVLRNGLVEASGAIVLEDGARQLALFSAGHDVGEGRGEAQIAADALGFGPTLQPYDITEQARGLVDNVTGQASATADIRWTRQRIDGVGSVRLDGVSLATSTIPVINDIHGEINFDDLFALTTAPGQRITVGLLDTGVPVRNGRVRFQLLPDRRVAIEDAEFEFAGGVLAMAPNTITLGAEETRFELRLRDIDAAELLASLNIPDLSASGRVEGEFPLLLTRRTAYIENGVLRAREGGGVISYTGNAGQAATGPARIAFEALQRFRYDDLTLTLNGDLSGEVVSGIVFSGRNSGRPIDLGAIAPVPGLGNVTVRGVPFQFNVTVTAPFRRLAQAAASFSDPASLLEQARDSEEQPQPVDQPPAERR